MTVAAADVLSTRRLGRATLARQLLLEPAALGEDLARFVEPHEPAVYSRYRRWRTDDR